MNVHREERERYALVVHANATTCSAIRTSLESAGYDVDTCPGPHVIECLVERGWPCAKVFRAVGCDALAILELGSDERCALGKGSLARIEEYGELFDDLLVVEHDEEPDMTLARLPLHMLRHR